MLRIIAATILTAAFLIGLQDLAANGMWLQLAMFGLSAFGFGALLMFQTVAQS